MKWKGRRRSTNVVDSRGKVVPHSFTHGTSEQRMRWFNKGLESGRIGGGDTFKMPYGSL